MYLVTTEGVVCCSDGVCVRLPPRLGDPAHSALPGRAAQRLYGPLLVQPQRAATLQPPQEHVAASPAATRVTDYLTTYSSIQLLNISPFQIVSCFLDINFQNIVRKTSLEYRERIIS